MEEIKDKVNIHYLKIVIDFIEYPIIGYDFDDIIEDFGNKELLKKLEMRMLNINRRMRHYIRKSLRYKYSKPISLGNKFKKNQTKGQRKGYWYKSLLLIKNMIKKGREEEAVQFAKGQVEWLKERRPATYYRHKKDLKEIGIEIS